MARLGQVGVAYPYYFNVHRGGAPRLGLVLANFDISVIGASAGLFVPSSLSEIGNGRYLFTITAGFSTAEGAGQYHANIEIILAPVVLGGAPIEYFAESIDTLARRSEYTAARAANLDEITAARLAELDAANIPLDLATILAAIGALNDPTVAAIVAGVWSEALPGAFTPGQAGAILASIVSAIRGADDRDLSELAGAGWLAGTDTLEAIRDAIDGIGGSGVRGHAVNPGVAP